MAILNFWNSLHDGGHVQVGAPDARPNAEEMALLAEAVRATDADWRLELPGDAPPLVMDVALWATESMYRACQFLAFREVPPEVISEAMAAPCPAPPAPDVCYSADLALRVLPDLITLARAVSPGDPLVTALSDVARKWPLSSVGVVGLEGDWDVNPFIEHPTLRRLYADRIIVHGDATRLAEPRTAAAVREALGGHRELAPASVIKALEGSA